MSHTGTSAHTPEVAQLYDALHARRQRLRALYNDEKAYFRFLVHEVRDLELDEEFVDRSRLAAEKAEALLALRQAEPRASLAWVTQTIDDRFAERERLLEKRMERLDARADQHREAMRRHESDAGWRALLEEIEAPPPVAPPPPLPQMQLQPLYRALVKRCHPDLARTEAERRRNEALMRPINTAFAAKDLVALRRIGVDVGLASVAPAASSAASPPVDNAGWLRAELGQWDRLITSVEARQAARHSERSYHLWQRYKARDFEIDRLKARCREERVGYQKRIEAAEIASGVRWVHNKKRSWWRFWS